MEYFLCSVSIVPPTPDFRPTIGAVFEAILRNAIGLKGAKVLFEPCGDPSDGDYFRVRLVSGDPIDVDVLDGIGDITIGLIQRVVGKTAGALGWAVEYLDIQPWVFRCSGIVHLRVLAALRKFASPHYSGNLVTVANRHGHPVFRLAVGTPLGSTKHASLGAVTGQVQGIVRTRFSGQRIKVRCSPYRLRTLAVAATLNSEMLVGKSVLAYVRPVRGGAYYAADLVTTPQLTLF